MKKLNKIQATIKIVDLMVRHRITTTMIMKELVYAIKLKKKQIHINLETK